MGRLIDVDKTIKQLDNKSAQITLDLPVEEMLGEEIDLEVFSKLMQDAIMAYKKMIVDTLKRQPTAYDLDNVVEQLENERKFWENAYDSNLGKEKARSYAHAIEIVKGGGVDA